MKIEKENLEGGKLRDVLKRIDGYDEIRDENLNSLHYSARCRVISSGAKIQADMLFIDSGVIFLERGEKRRRMWLVRYSSVADSKLYDKKDEVYLRIMVDGTDRSVLCALHDRNMAQKIAMIIRIGKENSHRKTRAPATPEEAKKWVSVIRFGNLRFIISCDRGTDLAAFKKKAIHRLGRHFYPDKGIFESSIDLSKYSEFLFYINYDGTYILLEGDPDFRAAVDFFNERLDVLITMKKTRTKVGPGTINELADKHIDRHISDL